MRVKMTRCRLGASLIVAIRGPVRSESDFGQCLSTADDEATSRHVIVDLSEVSWLDPDAAPPLLDAYWRVTGRGGRFSVVAPDQRVRMALMLTALDWLIPIYSSMRAAEVDEAH